MQHAGNLLSLAVISIICFFRTVRNCEKTCTIKDVTIVKGARVQIPIYSLHHSSEYWEEPEQFIPERFSNNYNNY